MVAARKIAPAKKAQAKIQDVPENLPRNTVALALVESLLQTPDVAGYRDRRCFVNPPMASELIRLNYSGQRNIRLDQVRRLTDAQASKNYAPNNIIAFSYNPDNPTDTSMVVLLNGQHTLHSIIQSGTTQPLIISLFPCRTKADIEFHYSLFDQGRGRNQQDVSRAVGLADMVRHHKLPQQALNALGAAATLMRAHLTDARFAPKDKLLSARISRDWMSETAAVYALIGPADRRINPDAPPIGDLGKLFRKRLVSPSFFAVVLVAMRSHPEETTDTIKSLVAMADSADQGEVEGDQFTWDVVDFLTECSLGSGTDRRIATRNFIHLMAALRGRLRDGDGGEEIRKIITDATPSIADSEALWDVLTEDKLARSIVNV